MRNKDDWGEALFGVLVVVCMVSFAAWLLFEMLPVMAAIAWMTVR